MKRGGGRLLTSFCACSLFASSFSGSSLAVNVATSIAPTIGPLAVNLTQSVRFRGADFGQRLKFTEREERRKGSTKEEKADQFRVQDEIESYVATGYPRELLDLFEKHYQLAEDCKVRNLSPAQAVEKLKISLAESGGKQTVLRPLVQLATIVKSKAHELQVVPKQSSSLGPIVHALSKALPELGATKDTTGTKIVCKLNPMTRERRDKCSEEIKDHHQKFLLAATKVRTAGVQHIEQAGLKDLSLVKQRVDELSEAHNILMEEKKEEFHMLADSVYDEIDEDGDIVHHTPDEKS